MVKKSRDASSWGGAGATAVVAATVAHGLIRKDESDQSPQQEKETKVDKPKPSTSAKELLGDNYTFTDLKIGAPNLDGTYIITSHDIGIKKNDGIQTDTFYMSGNPEGSGSNVSVKAGLAESKDGKNRYVQVIIDNATGSTKKERELPMSTVVIEFAKKDGIVHDSSRKRIEGKKVDKWEKDGASFFIPIKVESGRANDRAKFNNVIGWQTFGEMPDIVVNVGEDNPKERTTKKVAFYIESLESISQRYEGVRTRFDELMKEKKGSEHAQQLIKEDYAFMIEYKQTIFSEYGSSVADEIFGTLDNFNN